MGILAWLFGKRTDTPGVYRIRNRKNGWVYIGSTQRTTQVRCEEHLWRLHAGTHPNPLLQADWDRYGSKAFAFEVIENTDKAQAETRELFWQQRIPVDKSYVLRLARPALYAQQRKEQHRQTTQALTDALILLGWTDEDFFRVFKARVATSIIERRNIIDWNDDTPIRILKEKISSGGGS